MTNEELKKKICDIIAPYVSAWGNDERIADALIAAGIGDVKTVQQISASATVLAVLEAAKAEHRAEVAELALMYAVSEYRCDECPLIDCICEEYKKQAEKGSR